MIQQIFLHIIGKITQLLIENKEFFSLNSDQKSSLIKELPQSIQSYLNKVTEKEFIADLSRVTVKLKQEKYDGLNDQNGLVNAMVNYLLNEVASLMDKLPAEFFMHNVNEKRKFLAEKGKLPEVFVDIFSTYNYQQIFEELFNFIKGVKKDFPYIVIQFARDPDSETKREIRQYFQKKFGDAFPKLQISKYLLGGMRTLVNGKITDQSWIGKIDRFTSELSLK